VYRKAAAKWEDKNWLAERYNGRRRLQDDLSHCHSVFMSIFNIEMAQLTAEVNQQYRTALIPAEVRLILYFVHQRHKTSHANLTLADSLDGVMSIIDSAKLLCAQQWPVSLERFRTVLTKVVERYEEILKEAHTLGVNMWTADRKFTGWIWEIASEVERAKNQEEVS
jgi:hypothetical protein